jgi:hypothetical protein
MARNQLEKYLNQLVIRKADYLEKQRKDYKFPRFQKSLEILQRASYYHTIPDDVISKIELIFKLMPTHELYYIKKDETQFKEYINELNQLYIAVLDDYEEYLEVSNSYLKTIMDILFPLMLLTLLFYDKFQKWIGLNFTLISIMLLLIFLLYINRKNFGKIRINLIKV